MNVDSTKLALMTTPQQASLTEVADYTTSQTISSNTKVLSAMNLLAAENNSHYMPIDFFLPRIYLIRLSVLIFFTISTITVDYTPNELNLPRLIYDTPVESCR